MRVNFTVLIYLSICLGISIPFNLTIIQLLFTEDGIPAGADSAFHTFAIMKILDSGNPLISYTAFPPLSQNSSSFYPSLMHTMIASIAVVFAVNDPATVLSIEKLFMLAVSLLGTIGYALLIKNILYTAIMSRMLNAKYLFYNSRIRILFLITSVLAFGIFIYSIAPVIKTFNDGTYSQLTAMWLFFPYYMTLLINGRWIICAIVLAIIASIHNLSFLMTLAATVPYLISSYLQGTRTIRIKLLKSIVIFGVLALPALIFFYLPSTFYVLRGDAAESVYSPWPQHELIQQITPGLYYVGSICIALVMIINYRKLGWITGWALIYLLVFALSSELGARFGRELSVVFGLSTGLSVAYILFMYFTTGKRFITPGRFDIANTPRSSGMIILFLFITLGLLTTSYLYFENRIYGESNPNVVKYFTDAFNRSNEYFLTLSDESSNSSFSDHGKKVIVLFGENPWLKVSAYEKYDVLSVQPDKDGSIGEGDRQINSELFRIVSNSTEDSTACVIENYKVDYVYISDLISDRWYPAESEVYHKSLNLFQNDSLSPFFILEAEFFGNNDEHLRIYSIVKKNVSEACER